MTPRCVGVTVPVTGKPCQPCVTCDRHAWPPSSAAPFISPPAYFDGERWHCREHINADVRPVEG